MRVKLEKNECNCLEFEYICHFFPIGSEDFDRSLIFVIILKVEPNL